MDAALWESRAKLEMISFSPSIICLARTVECDTHNQLADREGITWTNDSSLLHPPRLCKLNTRNPNLASPQISVKTVYRSLGIEVIAAGFCVSLDVRNATSRDIPRFSSARGVKALHSWPETWSRHGLSFTACGLGSLRPSTMKTDCSKQEQRISS